MTARVPSYVNPAAARRAALTLPWLCICGALVGFLSFPVPLRSPLTVARLVQIGWSVTLLGVLHVFRRRLEVTEHLSIFFLSALPPFFLIWATGIHREALGHSWEPFLRQKLLVIVFAVLSPGELFYSAILVILFSLETCLEYWIGGLQKSPQLGRDEPWVTLLFSVIALLILINQSRAAVREQSHLERLRTAAEDRRMARVSLSLRDLANTPLQTLEIAIALLSRSSAAAPPADDTDGAPGVPLHRCVSIMRRSVGQLHALSRVLERFERRTEWPAPVEGLDGFQDGVQEDGFRKNKPL